MRLVGALLASWLITACAVIPPDNTPVFSSYISTISAAVRLATDDARATGFHVGGGFFVSVHHFDHNTTDLRLWDGRVVPARRIWSDQAADLSIFFAENIDLVPSLRFRCGVPLATGERIYMVGFPGGDDIAATVAWGNVGIAIPDSEGHVSADLAAPAGTSGAPVIDSRGLVVGVGPGNPGAEVPHHGRHAYRPARGCLSGSARDPLHDPRAAPSARDLSLHSVKVRGGSPQVY